MRDHLYAKAIDLERWAAEQPSRTDMRTDGRSSSRTSSDRGVSCTTEIAGIELALEGYALREEFGDLRGRELVLRARRAE